MLQVTDLVKTFTGGSSARRRGTDNGQAGVRAIDDISFEVGQGEVFTLLGPSGCGKSTTLRSIAGLEQPDSGEIRIAGETVFSDSERIRLGPDERNLSMVFQSYAIWPHMNVFRNVAFPLEVLPRKLRPSRAEIKERVGDVLAAVELGGLESRSAVKLSGGQQQRLALARAMVTNPNLLLLDEPLSNLDAKLRESMRLELKRLQRSLGLTSLYVTHDQGEALALSSRIAVMQHGRIRQIGTPREIYENPSCRFVSEFIGTSNIIEGTVSAVAGEVAHIDTADGPLRSTCWRDLSVGDTVTVLIRPEDLRILDETTPDEEFNGWRGKVLTGAYLGEAIDYIVSADSRELRCRVNASQSGRAGTQAAVAVDPARVRVLLPEPPPEQSVPRAA